MGRPLNIKKAFQNREERILVLIVILFIFSMPLLINYTNPPRGMLIRKNLESEADGAFLVNEIYQETKPIDILFVGPCTIWWQIYTPYIKLELDKKLQRNTNVITLGFNHFGSDLIYLILKDITQRRKVRNLVLSLPKMEDLRPFPHKNASFWWRYPKDLSFEGLSIVGQAKLFGISMFSSVPRTFQILEEKREQWPTVSRKELGFNEFRSGSKLTPSEIENIGNKVMPKVTSLMQLGSSPHSEFSADWILFYKEIARITEEQNIRVIFVDSPHSIEFEEDVATVPTGFEKYFPNSSAVMLDFKKWQKNLPEKYQTQLIAGSNLTVLGAQLFTKTIVSALIDETKNE